MFERFNDQGRRVVVLAQEESRLLSHNYIGTEHILLGLLREQDTVAANTLASLGISLNSAREQVLELVGTGGQAPSGHIPFTPRAKQVLEYALREALELGHDYIGSEHVLLGLLREGEGVAAQVLVRLGADLATTRARVVAILGNGTTESPAQTQPLTGVESNRGFISLPTISGRAGTISGHAGRCALCDRDLWDAPRYVRGETISICGDCIETSHRAIAQAPADEREVPFPPRVSGTDIDDADAPAAIVRAFRGVFSDTNDERADLLEDGARIVAYLETLEQSTPTGIVQSVRVNRIRFTSPDAADVRFAIVLQPGTPGHAFEGRALQVSGHWLVSRDTYARMVALVGVQLPPPE